jgi:redox-sensitive bicupin YhaK (pirin superfamily)
MNRRTFLARSTTALGIAGCSSGRADNRRDERTVEAAPSTTERSGDRTMKLTLRRSADRGHADHGWLDSHHTFSFADYHDPAHMGFRALRVINQDRVAAGMGFSTHPHRDMEIFSYVLEGALQHKDSMGNGRVLKPGEIQLMSAGTGVTHSEFNPSQSDGLHFLQIWIVPNQRGLQPSYTEWKPTSATANAQDVVVISPDGRDGSAVIHQDAIVHRLRLRAGESVAHTVQQGRGAWLQLITGELRAGGDTLRAGDGASTEDAGTLTLTANQPVEALLFDLGPFAGR